MTGARHNPGRLRLAMAPGAALLAAGFTWLTIRASMRQGRLMSYPTYDDVYYFSQGVKWLQIFESRGLSGLAAEYAARPPHAPYSTILAFVAFATTGVREWTPYAFNALLVLALLLVTLRLFRGLALWKQALALAVLLTAPLPAMAVHEFKPDAASGFCFALGVLLLLGRPAARWTWPHSVAVGACFAGSLLIKPSVFASTGLLIGAGFGLAGLLALASRELPRIRAIGRLARTGLLTLLLVAPHYAVAWRSTWAYFIRNIFGEWKDVWAVRTDLAGHLRWYLDGPSGSAMLGAHLWIALGVLVLAGITAVRLRDRAALLRAGAILLITLLAYALLTATKMKNITVGQPFHMLVILGSLGALAYTLRAESARRWRIPIASLALAAATITGALTFRWTFTAPPPQEALARRALVDRVLAEIAREAAASDRPIRVLLTTVGEVNGEVLSFLAARDRIPAEFTSYQKVDSADVLISEASTADLVIATEPGTGTVFSFLPVTKFEAEVAESLRRRPDLRLITKIPSPLGEGSYLLFRPRAAFEGFEVVGGLDRPEGPYPQWGLGHVRWGIGESTRLGITVPESGRVRLFLTCRSPLDSQRITISASGRDLAQLDLPARNRWRTLDTELPLPPGRHELELTYRQTDPASKRKLTVLFSALSVTPAINSAAVEDGHPES